MGSMGTEAAGWPGWGGKDVGGGRTEERGTEAVLGGGMETAEGSMEVGVVGVAVDAGSTESERQTLQPGWPQFDGPGAELSEHYGPAHLELAERDFTKRIERDSGE